MAGGQLAEFFATFGFKINKADIQKVDKQLDILEARARRLSERSLSNIKANVSGFGFSENFNTRLRKSLEVRMRQATGKAFKPEIKFGKVALPIAKIRFAKGFNAATRQAIKTKLDMISKNKSLSPKITISKFAVDKEALLRDTRQAVQYVENNIRMRIRTDARDPMVNRGGRGATGIGAAAGMGAASGGIGRGIFPAVGLGFGVGALNRINQELEGQRFAAQAVFGSPEKGQEGLDWLRDLANEVGMDYRSQGQPYIRMIASATNAGMGVGETQDMYAGISRYGRTMGLGKEDMKGSMRAVEQMLNKQQVYAEELKTQLAEKMPGVMSAMAEAVTGDRNNTKKLFKMMEQGEVSSIEYLTDFADILEKRALAGGAYLKAIKSSAAEQGRFTNVLNDLVRVFAESGFEKGQAGIFRTMSTFLADSTDLVEGFGEAWKYVEGLIRVPLGLIHDLSIGVGNLSEYTGMAKGNIVALGTVIGLLAFPFTRMFTLIAGGMAVLEDFTAFLSGRESAIGNFLEKMEKSNPTEYAATVKAIKESFTSISELVGVIYDGWVLIFDLLSDGSILSGVLSTIRTIANEIKAAADLVLLATGRKDPNAMNTHVGKDDGILSYALKGGARLLKDPVETVTERQANVFSNRQDIATFLKRLRDVQYDTRTMGEMQPTELRDLEQRRENVQQKRELLENTYNINITGNEVPSKLADEIMQKIEERDQQNYQQVSSKTASEG